jgi:large subunit ribosomal protein L31
MKSQIHPTYYSNATVTCACGNSFVTGSTKQSITVEVCYKCHPLYTGEEKLLDVKGRVDTFQKKQAYAQQYKATHATKKQKKEVKEEKKVKTLRELLNE